MSAILFAPHNDDETLFAFYQVLRHRPKVIFVLRSLKEELMGGPTHAVREAEAACAMKVAGVEWEQWEHLDTAPDWDAVWSSLERVLDDHHGTVISPAWEVGGHEQHNAVAQLVEAMWPDCIRYLTYKRGHRRSESPNEVIPTAEERILKTVALACYKSQAEFPPTAPWFGEDQREFLA